MSIYFAPKSGIVLGDILASSPNGLVAGVTFEPFTSGDTLWRSNARARRPCENLGASPISGPGTRQDKTAAWSVKSGTSDLAMLARSVASAEVAVHKSATFHSSSSRRCLRAVDGPGTWQGRSLVYPECCTRSQGRSWPEEAARFAAIARGYRRWLDRWACCVANGV